MRARSSSNIVGNSSSNPTTSNPKRRNRRRSNQRVELFALEESPVVIMVDQRTMAESLRTPTEGYAEAIVVPPILAEHFELKHSLINMMTSDQFFGLEKDNPHDHIRWFNKITSTIKYKDVPNHAIKLMLFPFSLAGAARRSLMNHFMRRGIGFLEFCRRWQSLGKKYSRCVDDYRKQIQGPQFTKQIGCFSSDGNSSSSDIAKLTHAVNQQTSVVTTAMTAILKQFQATPPPASVKAVEEICVTCGGAHPYYQCLAADGNTFPEYQDNIQGYVAAAAGNYNQGNSGYRPPGVANQTRPPGFVQQNGQNNQNRFSQPQGYNRGNNFNQNATYQAPIQQNQSVPLSELEKFKKINDVSMKAMQNQINNVKNELRNEMQSSIQASMSNQTNELKNMMASFFQMNTASTSGSGSLPSNTVANPKGELKAITTRSGLVLDGPTVPMPPPFINPEEDGTYWHSTPNSEPVTKSSSSPTLTSIEESDLIWEEFKAYLASDSFPPGNSNPSSPLPPFHNSLSGSTTSSSPSLPISETSDYSLEEFADELAHITFPPGNDDLPFDAESDLREIEYLLNHNPIKEMDSILEDSVDENSLDDNLVDTISEMFTKRKSRESKNLKLMNLVFLDQVEFPSFSLMWLTVFYEDFSEVDALSSTNNEDKVFNPGILIHENLFEVINLATMEKNVKKITNASLILEDFNPPLYELPFHKEVPGLGALHSFQTKNAEKSFQPRIITSKGVHTSLLSELSHRGTKAFKVIKIFKSPMEIFPCSYGE
ncbi:hypothetical protein Tco_1376714 [Tanacetum coccineum]